MKGAEFGKAIGIDRPANVKDKIRKWQLELDAGGNASADGAAADGGKEPADEKAPETPRGKSADEEKQTPKTPAPDPKPTPKARPLDDKDKETQTPKTPAPESKPTDKDKETQIPKTPGPDPKPTPKARPPDDKDKERQAPKTPVTPKAVLASAPTPSKSVEATSKSAKKPPPVHNKLDDELQIATAPKKRVVSDSHWRNKSPPKDASTATKRPSPKLYANAWVRPAARKVAENKEEGNKLVTTPSKPIVIVTSKSTGQKNRPKGQKTGEERPGSSGEGKENGKSADEGASVPTSPKKDAKSADEGAAPSTAPQAEKEKTELVRVRRRPRARTSPRGSLSAEDVSPGKARSVRLSETSLSEDPANLITVEYEQSETTPRSRDEIRERRRKGRRKVQSDVSGDTSPAEPVSTARRKANRQSQHREEEDVSGHSLEPVVPATPPQAFGSRLEAWLQTTPDPFQDADSRRRRKSKDSISTLELHLRDDKTDVTASTDSRDASKENEPVRISDSHRRRRERRSVAKFETPEKDEAPAAAASTEPKDSSAADKNAELTPTPTLKRRGAKRTQQSPTKDRAMSFPSRGIPDDDEAASSAPSSAVEQTAEPVKVSLAAPFESPAMRRIFPSTGKRLSTIASVETFATRLQQAAPSEAVGSEGPESAVPQKTIADAAAASSDVGSQLRVETSTIVSRRSTKRSRLASHADLISVLSMPEAGTRSVVSARSIRTNRSRLAVATVPDIMRELASDEAKYMRELRTLVDGVIPVLLSCVLSKSDSAVAAGLFSRSAQTDPSNVTKPIVDMGVSLERLKTLHKRCPKEDPDAFLSWAQSAQRVYADYIAAWRLGFQDVVISLAPADEDPFTPAKVVNGPEDGAPWDEGMPRNAEGYVVNGDGERVDVAYMLKRPLVRLKYLAKSIKVGIRGSLVELNDTCANALVLQGINHIRPTERGEKMTKNFQDLVTTARRRSNDEHARIEDEAAANIDPTRARDPRSLAPLAGVRVDLTRCVRARDHFDLHLYHSSGQEINCRVEVLLRDDAPGQGNGGDILICEVGNAERWLLLPPIQLNRVSARNGDLKGEIVVMIRGHQADGKEWSEVMSLTIDDEQVGFEWVQMLGLTPVPPQLSELKRDQAVEKPARPTSSHASSSSVSAATGSTPPQNSRTPSPHEIEIPIGEQAHAASKRWSYGTPERHHKSRTVSPITPPSGELVLARRYMDSSPVSPPSPVDSGARVEDGVSPAPPQSASRDDEDLQRTPRSLREAMQLVGTGSPSSLKRTKAKRRSKTLLSPSTSRASRQIVLDDPIQEEPEPKPSRKESKRRRSEQPNSTTSSLVSQSSKGYSVWMPTSEVEYSDESEEDDQSVDEDYDPPARPLVHRRASSVPTMDLPTIPKLRRSSQTSVPDDSDERSKSVDALVLLPPKAEDEEEPVKEDASPPEDDDKPPPVPLHRSPSPATPVTLKASNTPVFTPTLPGFKTKRRSSSPLKHEYEPSTCTESSSVSEEEVSEDDERSATSESSEDSLEDDVPAPLMPVVPPQPFPKVLPPASIYALPNETQPFPKVSPPASIYTLPNGTITPSQSASNTPYRTVPNGSTQASKAIASIFTWVDPGRWQDLHPDECSIVVTPGKIEVYELSAAHSKPLMTDGDDIIQPETKAPLIAVELTPLVPLRKSTAIDISIRSPPTAASRIKSGNNIMLRSRNPQECAQLYAMINHSRINNPTYIALQNARGPYGQSSWAEAMDRANAARPNPSSSTSWFSGTLGRRSSYRKTSTRAASISAATESSVGTMNSALKSALGRFSFGRSSLFNIRNSTLESRSTQSLDTMGESDGSNPLSRAGTPSGRAPGAPLGITNTKVRLYERESTTKWRDMGQARLSIMLPELPTQPSSSSSSSEKSGSVSPPLPGSGTATPATPPGTSSSPTLKPTPRAPGARNSSSNEKRILVTGKTHGETLLDVTLNESCFERVARSGIAVSVWEDIVGKDGVVGAAQTGGVAGARARVYMVQMRSERECAWCFGMLAGGRWAS